jgi:hypothetical protein
MREQENKYGIETLKATVVAIVAFAKSAIGSFGFMTVLAGAKAVFQIIPNITAIIREGSDLVAEEWTELGELLLTELTPMLGGFLQNRSTATGPDSPANDTILAKLFELVPKGSSSRSVGTVYSEEEKIAAAQGFVREFLPMFIDKGGALLSVQA